ncbi:putative endoplasmic reticulum protein [Papiliotrema laurentii]|uniref:ER membrane protein complex subunit 4 n=1 Tax=Papiliotrema laurentii TaxID=5418 RepID=A0AAD9FLZ5_PAPLA|nr:putative endoplasmic reticulum protein [Papiliotrema laurentii]
MPIRLNYTLAHPPKASIPDPPGYLPPKTAKELSRAQAPSADVVAKQHRKSTDLKMRRAWDLALSPAKTLPMQAVMLYFSGSGIQIFSLGMIFMLLTQPITAVFNIFKAFEALRPTPPPNASKKDKAVVAEPSYIPLAVPMIMFVLCQGLVLALGLYKCSTMGILPTGTSDWLQFETRSDPPEWSAAQLSSLG